MPRPKPRPRKRNATPNAPVPSDRALPVVLHGIGVRVRSARQTAGLSQEVAAARAGIDYKRYQRLEAGGVNPTARTLVRVAEAVGSDFWGLLGAEAPKPLVDAVGFAIPELAVASQSLGARPGRPRQEAARANPRGRKRR